MHDARMNSLGTSLHSACNNSGEHANSYSCTLTHSSGDRLEIKENRQVRSVVVRGCLLERVYFLHSLQPETG